MAGGNGKSGNEVLVQLLADVRVLKTASEQHTSSIGGMQTSIDAMQKSIGEMRRSQGDLTSAAVKMAGTLEGMIGAYGEQGARMDALEARISKLEGKK